MSGRMCMQSFVVLCCVLRKPWGFDLTGKIIKKFNTASIANLKAITSKFTDCSTKLNTFTVSVFTIDVSLNLALKTLICPKLLHSNYPSLVSSKPLKANHITTAKFIKKLFIWFICFNSWAKYQQKRSTTLFMFSGIKTDNQQQKTKQGYMTNTFCVIYMTVVIENLN